MLTGGIMSGIVLFLAFLLLNGIKSQENCDGFFDVESCNALRGFWCLIVVLVHIPASYQNRIQDLLGSFAYIGVTFFFMTSAYGLNFQMKKNPKKFEAFWKKRLPKLVIPCVLVNCTAAAVGWIEGKKVSLTSLVQINSWVLWLLVCYLLFWLSVRIFGGGAQGRNWTNIFVILFSVLIYIFKKHINETTWCSEIIGFIWGQLLFVYKDKIWNLSQSKKYIIISFALSTLCGGVYLKYKYILFWGDYLLKILLGMLILFFMLLTNCYFHYGNFISEFLGTISYEIYLSHGIAFGLIAYIAPEIDSGLFVLGSITLTILISVVVHKMSSIILNEVMHL